MGGPALRPIALGQVRQLRRMLPGQMQIIGVGGISRGQHVLDYLRNGAVAVQIATSLLQRRGAEVFERILTELISLY